MEPEFEDEVSVLSFDFHTVCVDDMAVKGYNSIFSTDSAEESEKERTRKSKLGKLARKRFEAMLRSLSSTHGELARCMAFSLEHAEASNEVSVLFHKHVSSFLSPESYVGCRHYYRLSPRRRHASAPQARSLASHL
jgi:hypothetical protein